VGLASSGGIYVWGDYPADTRGAWVQGTAFFLSKAGWIIELRQHATATGNYGSNPGNNETFTVGNVTYRWKDTIDNAQPNQVKRGVNNTASLANMVAAINGAAGRGTLYSTPTYKHALVGASTDGVSHITLTYLLEGTAGNGTPTTVGTLRGGGYTLRAESPQSGNGSSPFQVRVVLADNLQTEGSIRLVNLTMQGVVFPEVEKEFHCNVGPGERYRIVANRCQFFIYKEGVVGEQSGSFLAGGIPYIQDSTVCGGEVPTEIPEEVWWTATDAGLQAIGTQRASSSSGDAQIRTTDEVNQFTNIAGDVASIWRSTIAVWNDSLVERVFLGKVPYEMMGLWASNNWQNIVGHGDVLISSMLWRNEIPMLLEPFVCWCETLEDDLAVRGQLWDAWTITRQYSMDKVLRLESQYWLCLTHLYKWGTIILAVPTREPLRIEQALQNHYAW
jgi:hypothetical protein